jgi:hypothetical protein
VSVPALGPLTERHLVAVLARTPDTWPRRSYLELDRQAADEVAASSRLPRRLAGVLNPFSWMLVK